MKLHQLIEQETLSMTLSEVRKRVKEIVRKTNDNFHITGTEIEEEDPLIDMWVGFIGFFDGNPDLLQVEIHTVDSSEKLDLGNLYTGDDPTLLKKFQKLKDKKEADGDVSKTQDALFDVLDQLSKLWKFKGYFLDPDYKKLLPTPKRRTDLPHTGSFCFLFDNTDRFIRK